MKEIKIEVLQATPISVADTAICHCYKSKPYEDEERQLMRVHKVGNVQKHNSVLEHSVITFNIEGVSRGCLQQIVRHRIASYTVNSTRYALKKLIDKNTEYTYETDEGKRLAQELIRFTGIEQVDRASVQALENTRQILVAGVEQDYAKYSLPESFKTSLTLTINLRSLQNFISLRSDKHALWEIQLLAKALYQALPENYKTLVKSFMSEHLLETLETE